MTARMTAAEPSAISDVVMPEDIKPRPFTNTGEYR